MTFTDGKTSIPTAPVAIAEPEIHYESSSANYPPPYVPTATATPMPTSSSTAAPAPPKTTTTITHIPPPTQTRPAATTNTTTTTTTRIVKMRNLGRRPTGLKCPFCNQEMVTRTRDQIDAVTIVVMIILLLLFWPLFWLPLCMPGCKTTEHYCGRCNRQVGETKACE